MVLTKSSTYQPKIKYRYQCDYCKKLIRMRSNLIGHIEYHLENESDEPAVASTIDVHLKELKSDETKKQYRYQCDYCKKLILLKKNLIGHIRYHLQNEFSEDKELENSKDNQKRKKYYECDYCKKLILVKSNLIIHIQYHLEKASIKQVAEITLKKFRSHKCFLCNQMFETAESQYQHLLMHTGKKKFKCDCCRRAFDTRHRLRIHLEKHSKLKEYSCGICYKGFKHKTSQRTHVNKHFFDEKAQCPLCYKILNKQSYIRKHLETVHNKNRSKESYTCLVCDKVFTNNQCLTQHHLRMHVGSFKCSSCDKGFPSHSALARHFRVHSSEKPFRCHFCKKDFSRKCNLVRHILAVHEKEK